MTAIKSSTTVSSISHAASELRNGRAVVVVDATDREDEGDLTFAAEHATQELMAFLVRHTSGFVCAPAAPEVLDRLELPLMVASNQDSLRTAYTVSVDATHHVGTGISAEDRATTVRVLSDPMSSASDVIRPGHILPLRAALGGVRERPGHTEATVDLLRLAGLAPVGVIGELMNDDGTLMRGEALHAFCAEHELALISIADLVEHLEAVPTPGEALRSASRRPQAG